MNSKDKTKEALIKELKDLQNDYISMKESYEKEIADLRQKEEKIRKSEEIFRKAYMTSPDSVNINRLSDGLYVSINEGFTRIMGYTEEEAIGKTSLELNIWVNPADRKNLVKELKLKGEVKNFEARFRAKNGMIRYGLMSASIIDLDGVPHILNITRDITIRKQAEEALALEQYLMDVIMNNLPDHIYFKDRESRFIRINKDHARSFGLSDPSQAVGKTDFDFFTEEHARQAYKDEQIVIQTGQPLSKEEKLTWPDRPDTWSATTKLPMRDKEGNIIGTFGISRDITEYRKAHEDLEKEHNLLLTINAEKEKFFSILAHDLKSPLSAFLGATQILAEEIQNMTLEEIKEITVSMRGSATNIYGLLENLLEWSRLKRGMMDFMPETFNAKQKITASIEVLSESARKKEIKINYSLPEDLEIYADSHIFETVIRNLVSNAIKFTPKSGEISVSATATPDKNVEIKICDTGIGMNKELISKLFLLNEKTNRKGTEGEASSGLGLLLCKEFIEKHNGKIWVESEEGKGSTFCFTMPAKE